MTYNTHFSDGTYGMEAIFDFHNCDVSKFNPDDLVNFVNKIIEIADMEADGDPVVWEEHEAADLHLRGTSIFQWIKTSNIVLHTLELTDLALLNLFSCKPFDPKDIADYGKEFFAADKVDFTVVDRGKK